MSTDVAVEPLDPAVSHIPGESAPRLLDQTVADSLDATDTGKIRKVEMRAQSAAELGVGES